MSGRLALTQNPDSALADIVEDLERGKVIPVLGSDLFSAVHDGETLSLHSALAKACADRLDLPDAVRVQNLNDVFVEHIGAGGLPEDIYDALERVSDQVAPAELDWLHEFVAIPSVKLLVTTTFTGIVEKAVIHARNLRPDVRVYAKSQFDDLDPPYERLESPVVYHLFGKLAGYPNYVASEQDALEFLSSLQDKNYQPARLFDALRGNNLLLLGCRFPDWVTRFFLRGLMGKSLLEKSRSKRYLVESTFDPNEPLVLFLSRFSYRTSMIATQPVEFLRLLTRRWRERQGAAAPAAGTAAGTTSTEPASADSARGAVFISYASEDAEAAKALAEGLARQRIPVWHDKQRLHPGVDWDAVIQDAVRNCAYFLPVISSTSLGIREGYVRLEWNLAAERSKRFDPATPFIMPVVIDDTVLDGAHGVPAAFPSRQGVRLPGGAPDEGFLRRMVELMREYRAR